MWREHFFAAAAAAVRGTQATQTFDVSLLRVDVLELRVAARDKNRYCHAVWVDPEIMVQSDYRMAPPPYSFRLCSS